MPQDNRDSKPRLSDTAGGTDCKVGASVSPQESCAQADATAAEPVPTAARKIGLNRLSKAFQAKRARNMENTALPTAVPQAGVPGLQDVAQDCGSAPKKQLDWSKGSAKTAFNASDLDPAMKKVASGSGTIHMRAFRSKICFASRDRHAHGKHDFQAVPISEALKQLPFTGYHFVG